MDVDNLEGILIPMLGNAVVAAFDDGMDARDIVWEKLNVDSDRFLHFEDGAFKLHFRMSTATFESLVHLYSRVTNEAERFRRDDNFNLRHMLLAVLWVLATPDSFRSVALLFNLTPGVLHYHYRSVIANLAELTGQYVVWPSIEECAIFKRSIERKTGFPGTIGAIDGMHVTLCSKPTEEGQRYINRHHEPSIILQAVADPTLAFRDVYLGEPGSLHDSRVFRRSNLCTRLLEDPHMLDCDEHIIGDGAYILTDRVATPFRNNGHLTPRQRQYNHCHAKARSMVERAFGLLQSKWRRLIFLSSKDLQFAVQNVMACIMLHNFLINEGEDPPWVPHMPNGAGDMGDEDDNVPVDVDHPDIGLEPDHPLLAGARARGVEKRYHIVEMLPLND